MDRNTRFIISVPTFTSYPCPRALAQVAHEIHIDVRGTITDAIAVNITNREIPSGPITPGPRLITPMTHICALVNGPLRVLTNLRVLVRSLARLRNVQEPSDLSHQIPASSLVSVRNIGRRLLKPCFTFDVETREPTIATKRSGSKDTGDGQHLTLRSTAITRMSTGYGGTGGADVNTIGVSIA